MKREMSGLVFHARDLHPVVVHHRERQVIVVVHADDVLCVGLSKDLLWLCKEPQKTYNLKQHLECDNTGDVKCLNRVLRQGSGGG